MNHEINCARIRLINEKGDMVGILSLQEALALASEVSMDLVEVSPNSDPPVCKILDYGRYRYELQKKQATVRKSQKVIEVKEIKIRPNIEEHDFQVKMKSMKKFFDAGHKVKVTLRFRGREMVHQDLGQKVLQRIRDQWEGQAKVELEPKSEGRQIIMILAPCPS